MRLDSRMLEALEKAALEGYIIPRTENNRYLLVSYKGAGDLVSKKWNVKIYTSGSVVCNDEPLLIDIMNGQLKRSDKTKILIQVDDAGVGFPIGGTMVGVACNGNIETDVVDVSFFQGDQFKNQSYLIEYTNKGLYIIKNLFNATSETHRIEICTGFINKDLKKALRDQGFEVRVVEITGLLQDNLERLFKEYIKQSFGYNFAYDPKELKDKGGKSTVAQRYYEVVKWGKKNIPHKMKTGWKSLNYEL